MDPGARARFAFTGTQVSWIGLKEEYTGIANVYVDDILVATVDTYSRSAEYKSTFTPLQALLTRITR